MRGRFARHLGARRATSSTATNGSNDLLFVWPQRPIVSTPHRAENLNWTGGIMTKLLVFLQSYIATREQREDRGATMVEYGLLVVFIALVVALGATLLGKQLSSLFSSIGTAL